MKLTIPYRSLRIKITWVWVVVIFLLSCMGWQMLTEATLDGDSSDEQIHILSGYTTLTQAHVLFDPEHPFLAKTLAAIPLLFVHPQVPYAAAHLTPEQAKSNYNTYRQANQWGYDMLFASGNNPDQLLFLTRMVIAILTIALAAVVYIWVKSLWGTASSLAALALTAFEPSLIAHGHLANDDTIATLFFIAALAGFYTYLKKPTYRHVLLTGILLGLGLITKYSLLLLGPIFVVLLIGWLTIHRQPSPSIVPTIFRWLASHWQRYLAGLLAIFIIAWSVIWISYGSLILVNPAQNPTTVINVPQVPPVIATITPYVIPVMYAKGAALLFDPNNHGRDGYLLGSCYTGGRFDYFSIITFFKTPITTLLLFCLGCYLWWKNRRNNKFIPIVIITTLIIYLSISSLSKINIGYRHILPIGVLIIITAAYPFSKINWLRFRQSWQQRQDLTSRNTLAGSVLLVALAASLISGLAAFPNSLSYYNILAGEPNNRPFISADSNIDWGQGTKALYRYMQQHSINHVVLDNFTGTSEAESRGYPISPADPKNHQYQGYVALSRSTIIDHYCSKQNDWGWVVDHFQPVAIIGGSINLYQLK